MKAYIERPISEKPEKVGWYFVKFTYLNDEIHSHSLFCNTLGWLEDIDPNGVWLQPVEIAECDDFKYPSAKEAGGDKSWDQMSDLEKANYNLCKALNALCVDKLTIKRLRGKLAQPSPVVNTDVPGDPIAELLDKITPEMQKQVDYSMSLELQIHELKTALQDLQENNYSNYDVRMKAGKALSQFTTPQLDNKEEKK